MVGVHVAPGMLALAWVQLAAAFAVRQSTACEVHRRCVLFGSIWNGLMNCPRPVLGMPLVADAKLPPSLTDLRMLTPVVSAYSTVVAPLVFLSIAVQPPSPPKIELHWFALCVASFRRDVPLSCVPPKYLVP